MHQSALWLTIVATGVALSGAGCMTAPQRPADNLVENLLTIVVVAIEAPPILAYPETAADRQALLAAGTNAPANGSKPWTLRLNALLPGVGLVVGGAIDLAANESASTRWQGKVLVLTSESAPWMPTTTLAAHAARLIGERSPRHAIVIEGYAKVPVGDTSAGGSAQYWPAGRLWYNAEVSMLDRDAELRALGDAILEVGLLNYEYYEHRLVLQVTVKLVDSVTGRVVARAAELSSSKAQSLAVMIQNQGAPLRDLANSTGQALLVKCLQDIGLASR
jgi:hypothetical protein